MLHTRSLSELGVCARLRINAYKLIEKICEIIKRKQTEINVITLFLSASGGGIHRKCEESSGTRGQGFLECFPVLSFRFINWHPTSQREWRDQNNKTCSSSARPPQRQQAFSFWVLLSIFHCIKRSETERRQRSIILYKYETITCNHKSAALLFETKAKKFMRRIHK